MTATATYTSATKQLAVTGDGLPDPVSYGTFPNLNNPNAVTEQAFAHTFRYRGGEFGVERTFDDNTYFQSGFVISVNISVNDNALFAALAASAAEEKKLPDINISPAASSATLVIALPSMS